MSAPANPASTAQEPHQRAVANREPSATPWQLPHAEPTIAGGLLFLLPVLERLGFNDWCRTAEEPVRAEILARHIFHVLLSRLDVPPDDPAWLLADTPPPTSDDMAAAILPHEYWLTRCRQWLRRRARIGLATLVMRPARLTLTRTHADVFFRMNSGDVRIRRAGLDVDPGWVPWFGRVVTFHYEDRPWK